ncbi:MAG: FG-GAP-like repeat-containing protein [Candidatus Eiseniibacteriota bacterium]
MNAAPSLCTLLLVFAPAGPARPANAADPAFAASTAPEPDPAVLAAGADEDWWRVVAEQLARGGASGTVSGAGTTPAWTADGDLYGALFGASVTTAGDVNGDGYSDVIVAAPAWSNSAFEEGAAFVYHGSAAGLSTTPAWTGEGNQHQAFFGSCAATAGDVNGDGYSDVIVGASYYDADLTDEGRAFVYHGSPAGLSTIPAWVMNGHQSDSRFGASVATAGDVNGDGYSDVIVGAPYTDNGELDEGLAYVYHGSASGLSVFHSWTTEGNQANAYLGWSVATAGDVNGDGYADVIVGAHGLDNGNVNEGLALVYHGSAVGLAFSSAWSVEGGQDYAGLGQSVATAGDVNGDGCSDILVGAPAFNNGQTNEGLTFVYHGSPAGLAALPAVALESNLAFSLFAASVATAGDVNGDGYADVLVGAYNYYDSSLITRGRAYLYHGSAAGLVPSPVWFVDGAQDYAEFGHCVAPAGDVNGDGFSDVLVGSPRLDDAQPDEGRTFLYLGTPSGPTAAAVWAVESDEPASQLGRSAASAGDVNGDGFADVIVGAFQYDNGQSLEGRAFIYHGSATGLSTTPAWSAEGDQAGARFGSSVAGAGDVNGDGFADVIVGAYLYDNGQTDEGRAFLYLGSAGGLSTTPAWTAESDQAAAEFGVVAGAGDVNGDGFADVIVGSRLYDNGQTSEGRAWVYHGSAAGLSVAPAWTAESDQAGAEFGVCVATAGDVNRDGFSDVIVGSFLYDDDLADQGRAFVYHGSPAGLSPVAAWTADGVQIGDRLGLSVSTAGDVNGDGFSDVIAGAYLYDNGQGSEGAAFVYHGSPTGLSPTAAWSAEGDQDAAYFGSCVATAGDVSGDGFSDVIVGAYLFDNGETDEGRAFVYLGSETGLSPAAAWTAESQQAGAAFGVSVAAAGDMNGDGFSDVVASACLFDNGHLDEGRIFAFYGNGGAGRATHARQLRTDGTTPIAPLGRSDGEAEFRIRAILSSGYGRTRLQMEHEVKPLSTPFDGQGTVTGPWFDVGQDGVIELERLVSGLSSGMQYHWRVRAKYDPAKTPFQSRGPWTQGTINGHNEAHLRTAGVLVVAAPVVGTPGGAGRIELVPAGPNPSWGNFALRLTLGERARVHADVVDVAGRRVVELIPGEVYEPGSYPLTWDARSGSRVPVAGVYFLRVQAGRETRVQKLVLLR